MHESMVLSLLQDGHRLVVGDVVASAGLAQIISHVADSYTPVPIVVRTALIQFFAAVTAGAYPHSDMALVSLQPIRNMLYVNGLVLHGNGFLDRDDMHSDA